MSPFVSLATTAMLLCPHTTAFVLVASRARAAQSTVTDDIHVTRGRPLLREGFASLVSSSQRHGNRRLLGAEAGGVSKQGSNKGIEMNVNGNPPRSVLERPWDVEVDLHGERRVITVQPGDSILEAAEMSGMNLSYDCRRGNCISCAAKVQKGSSEHFVNKADRNAEEGAPDGFILTCSTHPTGPGVKLELSANADMWDAYCTRFDDINTQALLRKASASLMTKYRIGHPEEFREEVERQFEEPEA